MSQHASLFEQMNRQHWNGVKLAVSLQSWHFYDIWAVSLITIMTFWWQLSCQSHYNHKICMAIKLAFSLQSWHFPKQSSWQSRSYQDNIHDNQTYAIMDFFMAVKLADSLQSWNFSWQVKLAVSLLSWLSQPQLCSKKKFVGKILNEEIHSVCESLRM